MTKKQKFLIFGALILSLAINLVILGGAGYAALKFRDMGKEGWVEDRIERGERFFLRNLEDRDREIAREIFNNRRPQLKSALQDIQMARRELGEALRDKETSSDDIIKILDHSQDAAGRTNLAFHGLLKDMTTQLSPASRDKIGEHLRRHHRPGYRYMMNSDDRHMDRDDGPMHDGDRYMDRDGGSMHYNDRYKDRDDGPMNDSNRYMDRDGGSMHDGDRYKDRDDSPMHDYNDDNKSRD